MTMTILDLNQHIGKGKTPAYRGFMPDHIDLPEGVDNCLAEDVLSQPVEFLKWVALVGPRIAALDPDARAKLLAQMSSLANGQPPAVNILVGERNVAVTTTEMSGDINQG